MAKGQVASLGDDSVEIWACHPFLVSTTDPKNQIFPQEESASVISPLFTLVGKVPSPGNTATPRHPGNILNHLQLEAKSDIQMKKIRVWETVLLQSMKDMKYSPAPLAQD